MDILMNGSNATAKQSNPSAPSGGRVAVFARAESGVAAETAQRKSAKEQMSEAQRNDAVKNFKKNVESLASTNLKFSIDKDTEKVVIKVVDKETGDTIRQIPSEEVLALDKAMSRNQGMLLHDKA